MSVTMVELHNRLAHQVASPTTLQREQIRAHPERSVGILRMSGVKDPDWLDAVLQHHEYGDDTGYLYGSCTSELAQLLQRADVWPIRRLTSHAGHGIVAVLPPAALKVQMPLEKIVALAGG